MTQFFQLNPEVPGDEGPGTIVANMSRLQAGLDFVPEITHLEVEFDTWLGDDIAEATPCYIVSDNLATAIRQSSLSGYRFEDITITTTDVFDRWQAKMLDRPLPNFVRLLMDGSIKIRGDREVIAWSGHDICFGERVDWVSPLTPEQTMTNPPPYALVISERAMRVFSDFQLDNCDIYVLEQA